MNEKSCLNTHSVSDISFFLSLNKIVQIIYTPECCCPDKNYFPFPKNKQTNKKGKKTKKRQDSGQTRWRHHPSNSCMTRRDSTFGIFEKKKKKKSVSAGIGVTRLLFVSPKRARAILVVRVMSKILSFIFYLFFFFLPRTTPQFPPFFSRLVQRKKKKITSLSYRARQRKSKPVQRPSSSPEDQEESIKSCRVYTQERIRLLTYPSMGCTHSNSSYFSLGL